jgi:hypothetical protein
MGQRQNQHIAGFELTLTRKGQISHTAQMGVWTTDGLTSQAFRGDLVDADMGVTQEEAQ